MNNTLENLSVDAKNLDSADLEVCAISKRERMIRAVGMIAVIEDFSVDSKEYTINSSLFKASLEDRTRNEEHIIRGCH